MHGREAIKQFIAGFTAGFDGIDFQMTEIRTNVYERAHRLCTALMAADPAAGDGVFEVIDGRIAAWRDYFDLATVTSAFG